MDTFLAWINSRLHLPGFLFGIMIHLSVLSKEYEGTVALIHISERGEESLPHWVIWQISTSFWIWDACKKL